MPHQEIEKLKQDILVLQYRMGGAEFIIKTLIGKMHFNEVAAIKIEIETHISKYDADSATVKILEESLRLIGE